WRSVTSEELDILIDQLYGGKVFSQYFYVRKNKTINFLKNSPYNKKQQASTRYFIKVMMRT
ncbi:hypothetical protein, partial [Bacillus paralicheniformis]|uniref:hypothetical protein n=1 Tax=Bacillus paralicheniformis TaxID=1648923 RepID=UPI0020C06BD7